MVNTDIPARGELAGEIPLSFNQEQLWFSEQFHAGMPTYNVPHLVRLRGWLDLGGNSLQAMQLVSRLRSDLAVDIDVSAVFQAPAARQLAALLRGQQGLDDMDLEDNGTE